jgi:cytochrome c-type biogenesis protein CcmH/NrfF
VTIPRIALFLLPALLWGDTGRQLQSRIEHLENALLAPCCYSEPVSRHRSEIALRMREEIANWVAQGKPDREILDIYKARYGARVLVEPEGRAWWVVHVVPGIAFALGVGFAVLVLIRLRARPQAEPETHAAFADLPDLDDL